MNIGKVAISAWPTSAKSPLLGQIPLDPATCQGGDEGMPILVRAPDCAQTQAFRAVAGAVAARISTIALTPLPLLRIS